MVFQVPPSPERKPRIGYVVKRYPRFSETFIVNEILAHEAAGLDVEIFSIRPCNDTHYQNRISEVRAPHTQISSASRKASAFWMQAKRLENRFPDVWRILAAEQFADGVSVCQALDLAEAAQDNGITHLHAHFATLPTTVARLASQFARIPYSLTAHAKDIFHDSVHPGDLRQKLEDAAAIVTVSEFNLEHLTQLLGQQNGSLHRVYNGMHLDEFSFEEPGNREPVILGVGRLVEKKGFGYLVRACRTIRNSGLDFSCVIVGSGEEEESLRQLILKLDLADIVSLEGPMPQSEVKQWLHRAAVLAAPCVVGEDGNRDGLPTVLLEAMAMGTPCVATDVTGIPEVIDDGHTGLIVAQHDTDSLAKALKRLLTDKSLRATVAEHARGRIEDDFDAHRTSGQIRNIFDQCRRVGDTECAGALQEQA
jgi:colanic acid/amylovoran biosynthesis glycosyltransferase